jgi:hypothetical protein
MSHPSMEPRNLRDRGPILPRLLRLRSIRPGVLQRFWLVEGVGLVASLLVLADVASAWTLLVLPAVSALMVKLHDVVETELRRPTAVGRRSSS